ncbi:MAG TPA: twin-arginine translocation signal domain-containing protein [Candidatus Paceibacterota bacterium]|nr:twin-arginine translocation signal domain-containing protein [Candidatus Paceibacterota bacterium]
MSLEKPRPGRVSPEGNERQSQPSRRGFLTGIGVLAVGVATGVGLGIEGHKSDQKYEMEHTHHGIGRITKKEIVSRPPNFGMIGKNPTEIPQSPRYVIHIEVDGRIGEIDVDQEQYEKYAENQEIRVTYITNEQSSDIIVSKLE